MCLCVCERERERSENEVIKNANTLTTTYCRCSISKFKEVRQIWKKEKKKKERKEWNGGWLTLLQNIKLSRLPRIKLRKSDKGMKCGDDLICSLVK